MDPREYASMFALERTHWWFQARSAMIEGMLRECVWPHLGDRPRLIDLGCGTGLFLEKRSADSRACGADFSRDALRFSRANGIRALCQADATRLPYADACTDLVTAFDLIEHVPDDLALVREAWRVLRPGGLMMASVPAHPILWTGHDVSLHHMRRYRRPQFEAIWNQPGAGKWETLRMTAGFATIFPAALAVRVGKRLVSKGGPPRSDTRPAVPWLNRLMLAIHGPEIAWLAKHDLPAGVSFMTVRRKLA